jgi:allophanate hydrolase
MGATGHLWRPAPRTLPAGDDAMALVVCGAHMSGLPLSHQLTGLGATLLRRTRTAPCYRLYALPGGPPRRPGLERVRAGGAAIEVEVWRLPRASFGAFLAGIPAPLSIGSIELAEGGTAPGFLCEHYGLDGARDITAFGGWRRFLAAAG